MMAKYITIGLVFLLAYETIRCQTVPVPYGESDDNNSTTTTTTMKSMEKNVTKPPNFLIGFNRTIKPIPAAVVGLSVKSGEEKKSLDVIKTEMAKSFHPICLLLVISNAAFIPAIHIAWKAELLAEAVIFGMTMISSTFYHFCDGCFICIMPFSVLQFADFQSSSLAAWVTILLLARVPKRWLSTYHLVGSLFFATNNHYFIPFVWSYATLALTCLLVISVHWGYRYYKDYSKPEELNSGYFYVACASIIIGSILQASQNFNSSWANLYPYTHSLWHILLGISLALLLPKNNPFLSEKFSIFDNNKISDNQQEKFWDTKSALNIRPIGPVAPAPPPPIPNRIFSPKIIKSVQTTNTTASTETPVSNKI